MREFQDNEYANCDDYTDAEMAIIANWTSATDSQKQTICEKNNWHDTGLFQVDFA